MTYTFSVVCYRLINIVLKEKSKGQISHDLFDLSVSMIFIRITQKTLRNKTIPDRA